MISVNESEKKAKTKLLLGVLDNLYLFSKTYFVNAILIVSIADNFSILSRIYRNVCSAMPDCQVNLIYPFDSTFTIPHILADKFS